GFDVLQPVPLHHSRFVERRGRVGIVFQKLGRALSVIGEVEAAVDGGIGAPPYALDIVAPGRRNAHALPKLVGNDMLDSLQAKVVQRLGRGFDFVDLVGGEDVAGLLGPIGLALQDVVVEPQLLALLRPPGPRCRAPAPLFSLPPMSRGPSSRSRRAGSGSTWLRWCQSWSIRCRARWSFLRRR